MPAHEWYMVSNYHCYTNRKAINIRDKANREIHNISTCMRGYSGSCRAQR